MLISDGSASGIIGKANITFAANVLSVTGAITASGDITAFSDARYKQDVVTIDRPLEKLQKLRGVYYTPIEGGPRKSGVIAQEVEEVFPEVVITGTTDEHVKSVAYGNLVGLLIESVKSLQQRIQELERK
jgi:hypothetical protein